MITNHGSPRSYRPYSHEWKGLFTYDIFRIFPLPVAVTLTPLISTIILFQPVPSPCDDVICQCLLRGIVAILGDLNLTLIPGGGVDKVSNGNGVWVALGDNNAYDVKGCHCLGIGVGEVNSEFGPCTSCSCPRRQWWRCRDAAPDDAVRVDKLAAGPLLREATDLVEKIWAMTS